MGTFDEVYGNFVNSMFFFLLGVFGLAAVVNHSDLPSRLMVLFVKWFGNSAKKLVLAFGSTAWVLSAFMSDLAAAALGAGIVITLNNELDLPKKFVKCLMIIVPMGSMTGGVIMPISSAANATIMALLYQTNGTVMTFFQWMIAGVPAGVIGLILCWLGLLVVFKPEPLSDEVMDQIHAKFHEAGPLSTYDKKAIALIVCMLAMWLLGSWITVLNSTFVALIGLVVMFLPGVDLMTWDEYQRETPFDLIFMLGAMFSLCAAMTSCGTIEWVVSNITAGAEGWSTWQFFIIVSVMLVVLRAFIPNGAPVVVLITPALLGVGAVIGMDPMLLLIMLSVWCNMTFIMPVIDSQWLMTYRAGEFSVADLIKVGIPVSALLIIIFSFLLPVLAQASYVAA